MNDYTTYGVRELIERIHELEKELHVNERCKECNEPMYTVVRAHHHIENGEDVTK